MKLLQDITFSGKRVLIRADLNVPLDEQQQITDDNRITAFLPTLKAIREQGGRCVVMSHLGSPTGPNDKAFSLAPVAKKMSELLGITVNLAPDCVGPTVEGMVNALQNGEVLLLENLRFQAGESKNDPELSSLLARLGEVFVQDAFATAHRAHASMVGAPEKFQEKCLGLLVEKEMAFFDKALLTPKRPLCVVLGGAKVSSKLNVLINIADKADKLIIGGAMANTFLAAQGIQMGRSLYEPELTGKAMELLGTLARRDCKVYLPVDFWVGPNFPTSSGAAKGLARAVTSLEVPADSMALDIGPATSKLYAEALVNAETILWNGPMGAFEYEEYASGTHELIQAMASAHGTTVVGGGDTDSAIHQMGLAHKFDYISTAGGAFLALLEGKTLPAFAAMEK